MKYNLLFSFSLIHVCVEKCYSTESELHVLTASLSVLDLPSGPHNYRLEDLAYTRSGDKGDSANIGESSSCLLNLQHGQ